MRAVTFTLTCILAFSARAEEPLWIGRFDGVTDVPAPWQVLRFNKRVPATEYRLRVWDTVPAIEAVANNSMALLARMVSINLSATPVLCWRWRIDAPLKTADMRRKSGDDYAARVYVAFRLPPEALSIMTRAKLRLARSLYGDAVPDAALNYVWDNRQPIGTHMPNAYTDRTQMLVLRSGTARNGEWVSERRDVQQDFRQLFGATQATLELVAVASDTDDTHEGAHAGFADLHFVGAESSCLTR